MPLALNIDSRADQLVKKYDAEDSSDADSASDSVNASDPPDGAAGSGVESASADAENGGQAAAASPEAPTLEEKTNQLLEEKLAAVREENRIRRERLEAEEAAAKRAREEAEADRKAAADARAKYEGLGKKGSINDTLRALELDPRETFEAMKQEALEAGSPEAIERRFQERLTAERESWKKELEETVAPLKQTIEQLQARETELAKQAAESGFSSEFQQAIPGYDSLRIEHDDTVLLGIARSFRDDPKRYHDSRKAAGLTPTPRGFTMTDILDVLKALHEKHEAGRKERSSKIAPAAPEKGTKTVNGTTAPRNAGSALGNDLATSRASSTPSRPRESWNQRVRRLSGDR